jgi:Cu+-exporting ATPase
MKQRQTLKTAVRLGVTRPSVTDVLALHGNESDVLRFAAVVQKNSEHPLSEAIVRAAQERSLDLPNPDSFRAIPGHGVEARFGLSGLILGSRKLMADRGVDVGRLSPEAERLENEGKTVMFLAADGRLAGVIAVAEAAAAKTQQRMGIEGQGR